MSTYSLTRAIAWLFFAAAGSFFWLRNQFLVWLFGFPSYILQPPQAMWPHEVSSAYRLAVVAFCSGALGLGLIASLLLTFLLLGTLGILLIVPTGGMLG